MQEMQVLSLGWEDPLEEEMTTHSSILAWKISRTEEPGGLQSTGSQKDKTEATKQQTTGNHTDSKFQIRMRVLEFVLLGIAI